MRACGGGCERLRPEHVGTLSVVNSTAREEPRTQAVTPWTRLVRKGTGVSSTDV